MPDPSIDLEDVQEAAKQHNLMWKHYKRTAPWETALGRWVEFHDLVAGSGQCFMRVAVAATALFALVTAGKAAWDVVLQLLGP
jgi:hypothetical protein